MRTNISPTKALFKMIFLFPRWDMLGPWRVSSAAYSQQLICIDDRLNFPEGAPECSQWMCCS